MLLYLPFITRYFWNLFHLACFNEQIIINKLQIYTPWIMLYSIHCICIQLTPLHNYWMGLGKVAFCKVMTLIKIGFSELLFVKNICFFSFVCLELGLSGLMRALKCSKRAQLWISTPHFFKFREFRVLRLLKDVVFFVFSREKGIIFLKKSTVSGYCMQ